MAFFFRVDDRLIHGQTLYAWVPFLEASSVLVISDDADSEALRRCIALCESCGDVEVEVRSVEEGAAFLVERGCGEGSGESDDATVMVVVEDIGSAVELCRRGVSIERLNLGNIHHKDGGRTLAPSVILSDADEGCLEELVALGVEVEIREVPTSAPLPYVPGGDKGRSS